MSGIGPMSTAYGVNLWVGPFNTMLTSTAGSATDSTDKAFFYSFSVNAPVTVTTAKLLVGNATDHVDVGIYSSAGARLGSAGDTTLSGTGVVSISLTASVALVPGRRYYAAIAINGTTTLIYTAGSAAASGAVGAFDTAASFRTLSSFPLPSSVTPSALGTSRAYLIAFI